MSLIISTGTNISRLVSEEIERGRHKSEVYLCTFYLQISYNKDFRLFNRQRCTKPDRNIDSNSNIRCEVLCELQLLFPESSLVGQVQPQGKRLSEPTRLLSIVEVSSQRFR